MILTSSACQVWRTEPVTPQTLLETRRPYAVRVTRVDSSLVVVNNPELRGDTIVGTGPKGGEVRVPLDSVRSTATRRFSAGRTVGLVVGTAAAAVVALFVGSRSTARKPRVLADREVLPCAKAPATAFGWFF